MIVKLCVREVACHVDCFADIVIGFKVRFLCFLLLSRKKSSLEFSSMREWGRCL